MASPRENGRLSAETFLHRVWPVISAHCGGGEIIPVEFSETSDRMRDHLDVMAGIDGWQIVNGKGMRGLGSRIQKCSYPGWNSFTIRYSLPTGNDTEWPKRHRAVFHPSEGLLLPHWTVQAYVDQYGCGATVHTVGVVKTVEMVHHVAECLDAKGSCSRIKTNPADGVRFIPVFWKHLVECGVQVKTWHFAPICIQQQSLGFEGAP